MRPPSLRKCFSPLKIASLVEFSDVTEHTSKVRWRNATFHMFYDGRATSSSADVRRMVAAFTRDTLLYSPNGGVVDQVSSIRYVCKL